MCFVYWDGRCTVQFLLPKITPLPHSPLIAIDSFGNKVFKRKVKLSILFWVLMVKDVLLLKIRWKEGRVNFVRKGFFCEFLGIWISQVANVFVFRWQVENVTRSRFCLGDWMRMPNTLIPKELFLSVDISARAVGWELCCRSGFAQIMFRIHFMFAFLEWSVQLVTALWRHTLMWFNRKKFAQNSQWLFLCSPGMPLFRSLDNITRWKKTLVRMVPQLVRCVLWHHKTRPQYIAKKQQPVDVPWWKPLCAQLLLLLGSLFSHQFLARKGNSKWKSTFQHFWCLLFYNLFLIPKQNCWKNLFSFCSCFKVRLLFLGLSWK